MKSGVIEQADIVLSKCGRPIAPGAGIASVDVYAGFRYQTVVAQASTQQQPFEITGDAPFFLGAVSGIQAQAGADVFVQFRFPNGKSFQQVLRDWTQDPGVGSNRCVIDPEVECPPGTKLSITSSTAFATPQTSASLTILFEGVYRYYLSDPTYAERRVPFSQMASEMPRFLKTRNQNILAPRWMGPWFPGEGEKYWYTSPLSTFALPAAAQGVNPIIEVSTDSGWRFWCQRVLAVIALDQGSSGTPYIRIRESTGYQLTDDFVDLATLSGMMLPGWWVVPPGKSILADLMVPDAVGSGNFTVQLFYEGFRRALA